MPKLDQDELVSTAEAAQMLNRHVRSIHRLVQTGELVPVAKIPGRTGAYLFRRGDVEALKASA